MDFRNNSANVSAQFAIQKSAINNGNEKEKGTSSEIPSDGEPLKVQASGHKAVQGNLGNQIPAVIDLGDGFILKALQKPPRGERELNFYQHVSDEACVDSDLQMLKPFLPHFSGKIDRDGGSYLKLSNLIHGYRRPCVMDLKMGCITYDCNATQEKILSELKKFPPAKQLGFQITGMMIYDPVKETYEEIKKDYTRKLTEETIVPNGLSLFFRLHGEHSRGDLLPPLLVKLRMLEQWFSIQKKFSFIASSLLITYDGYQQLNGRPDHKLPYRSEKGQENSSEYSCISGGNREKQAAESVPLWGKCEELSKSNGTGRSISVISHGEQNSTDKIGLHLIDFAHVFPSDNIDHNVLFGIRKLISCLQSMIS
ncbi:hypothetical protein RRG08_034315 [Elysia crispata]|uniref:Kinase n=1 Tax=Elysia crispata TaxID=231223 RepID=A0AAE1AH88_9GAST|nr:hypothetical protein RRG08_034315 [Elysia crispata]